MRLNIKIIFLIYVCVVVYPLSLSARGAGTSAGSFLKIDTSARPVGMGGTFCGIADDVSGIQYNPAGLLQLNRKEILITHNEWIEGIRSEFLGYAHPLNENWVCGLTLNYLYVNDLIERDINGTESGKKFGGNDGVITFALGRKLQDNISAGANVKVIRESVKDKNDVAYGADVGFLYKLSGLRLGISAQNLGTKIKLHQESFSLPLNFKFGLGYKFIKNADVGLDVNLPADNKIDVRIGGEYWIAKILALRTGYKFSSDKNTGIGITVGAGFKLNDYLVDYSFMPYGDLGDTHRVSLNIKFGNNDKRVKIQGKKQEVIQEPEEKPQTETVVETLSPEKKQEKMRELFVAGQQEFKQEKYERAIEKFAEVVKLEPKHQVSRNNINRARIKIEDKNKQKIENYSATARNTVKQKKYKEAIQIYRKAIVEFPHQIGFYKELSGVHQQQNQFGLAADVYLACLEKNPDANDVRKDLALLYEEKMEKSAKLSFGKYLKKASAHWEKLLGTEYDSLAKEHLVK